MDLANRWTNMVLPYGEVPLKVFNYFKGGNLYPPNKKNTTPPKKTQIEYVGVGATFPLPT